MSDAEDRPARVEDERELALATPHAPTERFEDGRFTTVLPQVVEMYLRFYTP